MSHRSGRGGLDRGAPPAGISELPRQAAVPAVFVGSV